MDDVLSSSSSRALRYRVTGSAFIINEWFVQKRGLLHPDWIQEVLRPEETPFEKRFEAIKHQVDVLLKPGDKPKLVFDKPAVGAYVVHGKMTLKTPSDAWGPVLYQFCSSYAEKVAVYYDMTGNARMMEEVFRPTRSTGDQEHQLCAHPAITLAQPMNF